ncbi:hypothetical protein LUZ63_002433 [Rhynchospora breviuscula]|uniref:Alpha/beta hydrolase fold-3 domain-containing protein n=1 Tax=Rhynchospora breviuscula TaxID=2022672 RepID=A0A9Q0CYS5_9POAL|nr:hypothetical protein LUZ63_002433 [Rhynchospora breviuscula]
MDLADHIRSNFDHLTGRGAGSKNPTGYWQSCLQKTSLSTLPTTPLCASSYLIPCPAIVASVDYRLAPDHCLPAAFDDARDALRWAQSAVASDPCVRDFVDLTKFFLMGTSAGASATICYHVALDLISSKLNLSPLHLSGLVFNQPYFEGIARTASELAFANDKILPLPANNLLWKLALPLGSDRDHEYCNVVAKEAKEAKLLPPCLVRGHNGDPLFDRQKVFVEMLKKVGVTVVAKMGSPGHHAVELFNSEKATEMATDVKNFVYGGAEIGTPGTRPENKL